MAPLSSAELTTIGVQILIVLLVVRRSYRMTQGVPASVVRLVLMPALVGVLWAFTALESIFLTPWAVPYLLGLDVALLTLTTVLFAGVAQRAAVFYRNEAGAWCYRIGFAIAGIFLAVYLVRLALTLALFPAALEVGVPVSGYPPGPQQAALATIDAMFSVSVGLLLARSIGIYRGWRAAVADAR